MRRLAAVLLWLSGCARCGFQPEPGIKIVVPAMPTTLDWSMSDPNSWANYPVALATMRGLTSLGPNGEVYPGLADHWERTCREGRDIYTFHLRRDALWSDGVTPLIAEDFVFAWRRAAQGRERGEMLDVLGADQVLRLLDERAPAGEIKRAAEALGVEAIDGNTLRVTLTSPRNYFLARLANVYVFFPSPSRQLATLAEEKIRDYFERPQNGRPFSLGPFRVESWDRAAERVRLVRNKHSAFAPSIGPGEAAAEVVTLMKSEIGSALYDRGRVDFVFVDSPVALQEQPPSDLQREELLSTYFLAFNTQRPPLDRSDVRRALAAAIDRPALLEGLLPLARAAISLLPPGLPGSGAARVAAAHLDEGSARENVRRWGANTRRLRLVYRAGESFIPEVAIAERLKRQLARVGIQVDLDPRYDFFAEVARIARDGFPAPDFYLRRIGADYAHPKTFFTFFERGGNHYTGWERIDQGTAIQRFEDILQEADAMPEPSSAAPLYARAAAILIDEAAVIVPLYHPDRYYRVRPRLRGLRVDAFNFVSLRDMRAIDSKAGKNW